MTLKTLFIPFSLVALVMATGCSEEKEQDKLTLANPASKNCVEKGGELKIAKRGDGGQYGICYFEDNRQCEEWALMRGKCPVSGIKITGYTTPEGVYCAITGGNPENNETQCKLPSGKTCEAQKYYDGTCSD